MEGSLAYPPPPPPTGGVPSAHQPSSFGIDNILTGINNGAGAIGGGHYSTGYGPGPLQANHSNGDATSSMIMRKIDAAGMNNDHKRESISSMEDDDDGFRKKKKPRTAFSREQVAELEKKFTEKKYLSSAERGELAEKLKLSDMQVKTWFQNRRMKYKRQTEEAEMELKSPKYPYAPFVPYTSIYSYMPYKATTDFTTNNNNSGANGPGAAASVYHSSTTSHIHSCSQQYNTVSPGTTSPTSDTAAAGFNNGSNPSGTGAGGYPNNTTPPMMSPRYSPNQQQSHCGNFNGFFNRSGISPLSPPSTPNVSGGGNGYSGNYFSGSYVGTAHYSE